MTTSYRVGILGILLISALIAVIASPAFPVGQAVGIKHPVLQHGINPDDAAGYEKAVERLMAMSDDEMLSHVPDRPYVRFCDCPNCHGGSDGNLIYDWSIDHPEQLKCKYCGMVFPNDKYPCDQVMEGHNPLGEKVTYDYHQDQLRDDLRIFIPGHILMHKRQWILSQCRALGRAYQATGKAQYARRAALILDRLAQVYPHYPVMKQWTTTFEIAKRQQPPYPHRGGKWGPAMPSEMPGTVAACYDLVYDSDEFDKLSAIRGYDVRETLENDFLKAAWEYSNSPTVRTPPGAAPRHDSNGSAAVTLPAAAKIGRVINEPDYVHWAYKWLMEILMGGCHYDGMWWEAPSYHYYVMGGLRQAFATLKGYSDPPGYLNRNTGRRFDDLDPDRDIAFYARAKNAPAILAFPNGHSSPIHDTWTGNKYPARRFPPRNETVSTIRPGYGHACLGRGTGPNQMQAQLHFSKCHGHEHYDNLNLILYAKEREMLCDIGYTNTKLRCWSVMTPGHNLVAIDRKTQQSGWAGSGRRDAAGDLLAFFPDTDGVATVEADGKRAYYNIEGLEMYRRMLVLVPVSEADAYVVDIFRVQGGALHDWLLHGSADHDMTAECNVALRPGRENMMAAGEEWVEPRINSSSFSPYGAIRDVAEGNTDGDLVITFRYADDPARGVRTHLLGDGTTEVYLGRSPSVRRANEDNNMVYDFWMPQLVARRTGQAPLHSLFVAVEEPYAGGPFISKVEQLALTPADRNAVALRVTYGDTIDTIIGTVDEPPYPQRVTADGISIRGRLGIVRQKAASPGTGEARETLRAWLFEGEKLADGGWVLAAEKGRYEGRIQAATRKDDGAAHDAFIAEADLPAGDVLHGVWMIVTHGNGFTHGYEIDRVESLDGQTVIVLTGDHGLKIEGSVTEELFHPRRRIEGTNTFCIPLATTMTNTAP